MARESFWTSRSMLTYYIVHIFYSYYNNCEFRSKTFHIYTLLCLIIEVIRLGKSRTLWDSYEFQFNLWLNLWNKPCVMYLFFLRFRSFSQWKGQQMHTIQHSWLQLKLNMINMNIITMIKITVSQNKYRACFADDSMSLQPCRQSNIHTLTSPILFWEPDRLDTVDPTTPYNNVSKLLAIHANTSLPHKCTMWERAISELL